MNILCILYSHIVLYVCCVNIVLYLHCVNILCILICMYIVFTTNQVVSKEGFMYFAII